MVTEHTTIILTLELAFNRARAKVHPPNKHHQPRALPVCKGQAATFESLRPPKNSLIKETDSKRQSLNSTKFGFKFSSVVAMYAAHVNAGSES